MITREREIDGTLTSSRIRRKMPALCFAAMVFGLAALPAAASQVDTLVTSDTGGGCNSVGILQGTVSASLPFNLCQAAGNTLFGAGASAVADYLSLGTSASASWKSDLPGGSISASATAQSADVLTVGGGNPGDLGFLQFQFAISGTNLTTLTGFTGTSVADSFTNLIVCNFNPIFLPIAIGCPYPGAPEAIFHFDALSYSSLPVQVDVPIHFDVPWGVYFELYSTTGATIDPSFVVSFSGSSSFIDTAKITSVSVLDANLQPIANPTLVADSGTLYPLLGVTPPGPQPSVPEPSGLALLLTGAGLALAFGRRKNIWIRPKA